MPKIRRNRTKPPPEGWEMIEPTIRELERKMREAENKPHDGLRKNESIWPVFRLHHQRTRYIYELYTKRKAISKELFDYCVKEKYADAALISLWKKPGYEQVCCIGCVQTKDTSFGTTCICRVPKDKLEKNRIVECTSCGCRGCGG